MKDIKYLFIKFPDSKLNSVFLQKYIEGVRNRNLVIPDSIKKQFPNSLEKEESYVYFKEPPQECYLMCFEFYPFGIEFIHSPQVTNQLIDSKRYLGGGQLDRIITRFRNEILIPAEEYGKSHHLPDSVIYSPSFPYPKLADRK